MNATPLERYLRHLRMQQKELAVLTGLGAAAVNRVVLGKGCHPKTAVRILAALPEAAGLGFDERHILLPTVRPYADWNPPAT